MPKIETYTAKLNTPTPSVKQPLLMDENINANTYRAMQGFGNSMENFGQHLTKIAVQDDKIKAQKILNDHEEQRLTLESTDDVDEAGNITRYGWLNRKGEGAKGVLEESRKFDDDFVKAISKEDLLPAVKRELLDSINNSRLQSTSKLARHMANERLADQNLTIEQTKEIAKKRIYENTTPATLEQSIEKVKKVIDLSSNSPAMKEQLLAKGVDELVNKYLQGSEEDGSPFLEEALKDKGIRDLMDSDTQKAWDDRLETIKDVEIKDAKLAEDRTNKLLKEQVEYKVQARLTEAVELSNKGTLTHRWLMDSEIPYNSSEYRQVLNMIDAEKRGGKNPLTVTNSNYEADLMQKVFEGKVNPDDIKPIAGILSVNDAEKWRRMAEEGTPQIKRLYTSANNLIKSKITGGSAQIMPQDISGNMDTGALLGMLLKPEDQSKVIEAQAELAERLYNGVKAGKSRIDMLTYGNKDYIVDSVINTILGTEGGKIEAQKETKQGSVSTKRNAGETPKDYLKRIGRGTSK